MTLFKQVALLLPFLGAAAAVNLTCPDYYVYSTEQHPPYSGGVYNLSWQRPEPRCRTFNLSIVEDTVDRVSDDISDPDLKRLFVNSYVNTLDTAVKWKGYVNNGSDEELTFLITGGKALMTKTLTMPETMLIHTTFVHRHQCNVAARLCQPGPVISTSARGVGLSEFFGFVVQRRH